MGNSKTSSCFIHGDLIISPSLNWSASADCQLCKYVPQEVKGYGFHLHKGIKSARSITLQVVDQYF